MQEKPKVLIFPFELMSHYFRSIRFALELKDYFDIYIRQSDKYSNWIKEAGLKTFNCIDLIAETALEKIGNFDFSWLNAKDLETVYLEQRKVINEFNPVFVIGDTSFTLKMAAETTKTQYLSILNGYSTKYYKFTRMLAPSHPVFPFISWFPDFLLEPMVKLGEAYNFSNILKEFNKVRSKYELDKSDYYLDELSGNMNFICDLPELFPQKNLPDNYYFIGPLFPENTKNEKQLIERLNSNKETILVTIGSSKEWHHLSFLNNDIFSKFNIIVVGDKSNILSAPFFIKTSFVNFNEILPKVDLVICHGGNGTLYNALIHKIPVLCYESHLEQTWNVQRIYDLGYGESLNNIKTKNIFLLIDKWIKKKSSIYWNLNFLSYNSEKQKEIISENILNSFDMNMRNVLS